MLYAKNVDKIYGFFPQIYVTFLMLLPVMMYIINFEKQVLFINRK